MALFKKKERSSQQPPSITLPPIPVPLPEISEEEIENEGEEELLGEEPEEFEEEEELLEPEEMEEQIPVPTTPLVVKKPREEIPVQSKKEIPSSLEQPKEVPVSNDVLISALQNHEQRMINSETRMTEFGQRLTNIESFLFRRIREI